MGKPADGDERVGLDRASGGADSKDPVVDAALSAAEEGGLLSEAFDPDAPPKPLPAPSVLNEMMPPPPPAQYSRLELRQLLDVDDDDDTSAAEHCWSPLPSSTIPVRASSYLKDGKKAPSAHGSLLLAVELFRSPTAASHVAKRPDSPAHTLAKRTTSDVDFVFVVNMVLPAAEGVYQVVFYYGLLREQGGPSAASRLLERFINGTDAFRNARFKLIPTVVEGPWLVQKAVGNRPALLGKTLRQRWHRGDGYLEVDVDCNSSPAAGRVVSLVKSYSMALVVDLGFVLEAQTSDELPERVLGCGRMMHITLEDHALPRWPYELDGDAAEAAA